MNPGDRAWWVERGADRKPIHLTLVTILGASGGAPGFHVQSVRSDRKYYNVDLEDLWPLAAVKEPKR